MPIQLPKSTGGKVALGIGGVGLAYLVYRRFAGSSTSSLTGSSASTGSTTAAGTGQGAPTIDVYNNEPAEPSPPGKKPPGKKKGTGQGGGKPVHHPVYGNGGTKHKKPPKHQRGHGRTPGGGTPTPTPEPLFARRNSASHAKAKKINAEKSSHRSGKRTGHRTPVGKAR